MAKVIKTSTGLTGLAVVANPHHNLNALYSKILRVLTKMPEDAAYRKYTEQVIKTRLNAVQKNRDVTALEKAIGCGQVEEVIVQAENELILARKMLGWQPWQPLVQKPPAKQWDWPPAQITEPKR